MLILKRLIPKSSLLSLLILVALLSAALAQEPTNPTKDFLVTASVNGERLRVTAPSSIVQLRIELYNSARNQIFDYEVRGGNLLDWRLQDARSSVSSNRRSPHSSAWSALHCAPECKATSPAEPVCEH